MKVNPTTTAPVNTTGAKTPTPAAGVSSTKDPKKAQATQNAKSTAEVKRTDASSPSAVVKLGADGPEKAKIAPAQAEISNKSREMAKVLTTANQAPEVRSEKVNELKAKINSGTYEVDADAVADRLVDDHLRLPGA